MRGEPLARNKTELSRLQYQTMHNLILAHARVYKTYSEQFKTEQKGKLSFSLNSEWCEPKTDSEVDKNAADRCLQFMLGIFAHPVFVDGDYPAIVKNLTAWKSRAQGIPDILPTFTEEETEMVKGSYDFFALNHYTSVLASSKLFDQNTFGPDVEHSADPEWPLTGAYGFQKVPWCLRKLLKYIDDNYGQPAVFVSENGCVAPGEVNKSLPGRLRDDFRVDFFRRYTNEMLKAIILDGVNVQGYMAWTLMDNFEWGEGYTTPFGLHYVNFSDPERTRVPKDSAKFFKKLISNKGFPAVHPSTAPKQSFCTSFLLTSMFVALFMP